MIRAPGYVSAGMIAALLTVLLATMTVVTPRPVAAEEPLSELMRFPPGTAADRSESVEPNNLFTGSGGASPADLIEGWIALGADGDGGRAILSGTRFVSDEAAASAALGVFEAQQGDEVTLRGLGSLGDGWIATFDLRESAGELQGIVDDSGADRYVHDGFRVRGRDIVSFVYITDQPTPPQRQLAHMAWHTSTFGGSTVPLPEGGTALSYRIGQLLGVLLLALTVVAVVLRLAKRNRRPSRPSRTPAGPGRSGTPPQPPGTPSTAGGEQRPPQARVIW